jgi:hypothetical protein
MTSPAEGATGADARVRPRVRIPDRGGRGLGWDEPGRATGGPTRPRTWAACAAVGALHLYLEGSFASRVTSPEAAVALVP